MEGLIIDKQVHISTTEYCDGPSTRTRARKRQINEDLLLIADLEPVAPTDSVKNEVDQPENEEVDTKPFVEVHMDFEIGDIGVKVEKDSEWNCVEMGVRPKGRPGGHRGPYKCNLCHTQFSSSLGLSAHIRTHLPKTESGGLSKYECLTCHKRYTKSTTLNSHWIHHWEKKPYPCPTCPNGYATSKELRVHLITHSDAKPFECTNCSQTFKRGTELANHKAKRPHDFTTFLCSPCDLRFCLPMYFSKHMRDHKKATIPPKMHHCNICGQTMLRKLRDKHMKVHFQDKRPYPCSLCDKRFAAAGTLECHMRFHTGEKPYECTVCGKAFSQTSNLRTHAKVHKENPDKKFQCGVCFVKIKAEVSFKKHELMCGKLAEHAEEILTPLEVGKNGHRRSKVTFVCKKCEKKFEKKEYFLDHLFRDHLKVTFYDCTYCPKKFTQRAELQTHLRSHTGEEPFSCPVCSKRFKQATHLRGHMVVHSDDKPLSCPQCDKAFKTRACLVGHLRLHTKELPYACSLCPKAFPRSEVLKRHMNNHLGHRPHKCTQEGCNKAFITRGEVKLHMATHTDIRPFPCTICQHAFRTKSKLTDHLKSKTHIRNAKAASKGTKSKS